MKNGVPGKNPTAEAPRVVEEEPEDPKESDTLAAEPVATSAEQTAQEYQDIYHGPTGSGGADQETSDGIAESVQENVVKALLGGTYENHEAGQHPRKLLKRSHNLRKRKATAKSTKRKTYSVHDTGHCSTNIGTKPLR